MKRVENQNQRGAVSIFVVVFSAMFVTIITVSFVSLIIRGQQQAANADLSNSAYDAALAGVEDGKRLLLKYRQCLRDDSAYPNCAQIKDLLVSNNCNMVKVNATNFIDTSDEEMLIQSSDLAGDASAQALDQAYTCAKVAYTADKKEVEVPDGDSVLLPIESAGAAYDRVSVSWYTRNAGDATPLDIPTGSGAPLPRYTDWHSRNRPPIVRAQWIQHGEQFSSADFDNDVVDGADIRANTKTVFLYPKIDSGLPTYDLNTQDIRDESIGTAKSPTEVNCSASAYNDGGYACSVDLILPKPIGAGEKRTGFLQLAAFYKSTRVRVQLKNGATAVPIVAPSVDSTGRANDLFRRVRVGVSFTGEYPKANFDVRGDLCKDFAVSDTQYFAGACE